MNEKEADAIAQIAMYCEKIKRAQEKFFPTKDLFNEEALYRVGCAFYVQQIGEHVNDLSEGFIAAHAEIPWHQIRGFRNVIAHAYGNVDAEILWETITEDIPRLAAFCIHLQDERL